MKKSVLTISLILISSVSLAMESHDPLIAAPETVFEAFHAASAKEQFQMKERAFAQLPQPVQTHIKELAQQDDQTPFCTFFFDRGKVALLDLSEKSAEIFKKHLNSNHMLYLYLVSLIMPVKN